MQIVELTPEARKLVNVPIVEALAREGKDSVEMRVLELFNKQPGVFATDPPAIKASATIVVQGAGGTLAVYLDAEAYLSDRAYGHPFWIPTRTKLSEIKVCDIPKGLIIVQADDITGELLGHAPSEDDAYHVG